MAFAQQFEKAASCILQHCILVDYSNVVVIFSLSRMNWKEVTFFFSTPVSSAKLYAIIDPSVKEAESLLRSLFRDMAEPITYNIE